MFRLLLRPFKLIILLQEIENSISFSLRLVLNCCQMFWILFTSSFRVDIIGGKTWIVFTKCCIIYIYIVQEIYLYIYKRNSNILFYLYYVSFLLVVQLKNSHEAHRNLLHELVSRNKRKIIFFYFPYMFYYLWIIGKKGEDH